MGLLKKAQTAAMNRISGVRKLRAPSHEGHLPEYGVPCAKEVAVYMQQVRPLQYQHMQVRSWQSLGSSGSSAL